MFFIWTGNLSFYIVWYLSSAFLILLYRGGDSSMAILFDFFVCGGGILKNIKKSYLSLKKKK